VNLLFATDLSASGVVARSLLSSLSWVRGAHLEVVHVVPPRRGKGFPAFWQSPEKAATSERKAVAAFARQLHVKLTGRDMTVRSSLRVGDPTTCIITRADETNADLIVVGSRGRGQLASRVLGTVSAAVVERARQSVLVARTEMIRSLLLVDDASGNAQVAVDAVLGGSLFDAVHVTVARVVDLHIPLGEGLYQPRTVYEHYERILALRTRQAEAAVNTRVTQLRSSGRMAIGRVLQGDPATELLSVARSARADLIVLGAAGHDLTQGRLTHVARSVLLGFRGSVLIVRPRSATQTLDTCDTQLTAAPRNGSAQAPPRNNASSQTTRSADVVEHPHSL
jgi:nucleotide-binding universal stress UspA family protein